MRLSASIHRVAFLLTVTLLLLTPPVFAQKLTKHQLPDGTGSIGLAPGWKIASSYNGSVDCAGPNGAMIRLGIPFSFVGPTAPGVQMGIEHGENVPIGSPNDLVGCLKSLFVWMNNQSRKAGGPETHLVRIISVQPTASPTPGGTAAYIYYQFTTGGKPFTAYGLFASLAPDPTVWALYSSVVMAPSADFKKRFPEMLASWGSWSVSPAVARKAMLDAAAKMGGVSDIIHSVNENRKSAYDRVNAMWSEYFRQ